MKPAILAIFCILSLASNTASAGKKLYYQFLFKVGNSWKYNVKKTNSNGRIENWVEEHQVVAVERWGVLRVARLSVNFAVNGQPKKGRGYLLTYLTYQNRLYESRGRNKFSKSGALRWIRAHPPLMRWQMGITTWKHRRKPKESYRSGGLREFEIANQTFRYVKTFEQHEMLGRIKRKYWVSYRVGILQATLLARTPTGELKVIKKLVSYQVSRP